MGFLNGLVYCTLVQKDIVLWCNPIEKRSSARQRSDPTAYQLIYDDLCKLKSDLWKEVSAGKHGKPSDNNESQCLNVNTPSAGYCSK
jgi:hypothetical protein